MALLLLQQQALRLEFAAAMGAHYGVSAAEIGAILDDDSSASSTRAAGGDDAHGSSSSDDDSDVEFSDSEEEREFDAFLLQTLPNVAASRAPPPAAPLPAPDTCFGAPSSLETRSAMAAAAPPTHAPTDSTGRTTLSDRHAAVSVQRDGDGAPSIRSAPVSPTPQESAAATAAFDGGDDGDDDDDDDDDDDVSGWGDGDMDVSRWLSQAAHPPLQSASRLASQRKTTGAAVHPSPLPTASSRPQTTHSQSSAAPNPAVSADSPLTPACAPVAAAPVVSPVVSIRVSSLSDWRAGISTAMAQERESRMQLLRQAHQLTTAARAPALHSHAHGPRANRTLQDSAVAASSTSATR